jgi:hypothetical protein
LAADLRRHLAALSGNDPAAVAYDSIWHWQFSVSAPAKNVCRGSTLTYIKFLSANFYDGSSDLICIKLMRAKPAIIYQIIREQVMPIESALVSVFVLVVFTGFALVLAWAEHETRNLKTGGSQERAIQIRDGAAANE